MKLWTPSITILPCVMIDHNAGGKWRRSLTTIHSLGKDHNPMFRSNVAFTLLLATPVPLHIRCFTSFTCRCGYSLSINGAPVCAATVVFWSSLFFFSSVFVALVLSYFILHYIYLRSLFFARTSVAANDDARTLFLTWVVVSSLAARRP